MSRPQPATSIVYIQWVDSCSPSDSSWHKPEELNLNPLACETVGIVVSEDEKQISVASCKMENGSIYGVITIPKVAIIKRRKSKI